jgi:Ca-activated chloride channel family protein
VPVERGPDAPGGFLLDLSGDDVISVRQGDLLKGGAERTGGIYVDGSRTDTVKALAAFINAVSSESRLHGQRRESNPRWRFFIFAAMFCLGGNRIMGFSRRQRNRNFLPSRSLPVSALLCVLLLSSCSKTQSKLLVMEGNFFNTRGFYMEAISYYLKALDYEDAAPYAEYGLASAFFALEEGDAALDRYEEAGKALGLKREEHNELKYRIHYNRGIIHFEKGDYDEAVLAFRDALKVDGSRIEAKRNLELSLLTSLRSAPPQITYSREGTEDGIERAESSVLFEYLKAKEQEQWKSREWLGEDDVSGLDY